MIKGFIRRWKNYTFLKKDALFSQCIKNTGRLKYCLFFKPLKEKDNSHDDFRSDLTEWKPLYKSPSVLEAMYISGLWENPNEAYRRVMDAKDNQKAL